MPIRHAIWTVEDSPRPVPLGRMPTEAMLELIIKARPEILSSDWMLIGQQERTDFGGRIDLLASA